MTISQKRLLAIEQTRRIANALGSAAELMAGQPAVTNVEESTVEVVGLISSSLVLKCGFGHKNVALLIVAAYEAWSSIADASVAGAGIQRADDDLRQETWRELVSQAVNPLVSRRLQDLTVTATSGDQEIRAISPSCEVARLELMLGDKILPPVFLVWDDLLLEDLGTDMGGIEAEAPNSCLVPAALDRLLDIELPLSVSFGRTHLAVQDVLKLSTGSIIELNCPANDLVEIVVNNCMIARGEVVVIEGNYGVRIREIISRGDRLALRNSRGRVPGENRRLTA